MIELLKQPWPWYVAGAIIELIVPALLILGNKHFGISANFRHACAACFPSNIKCFKYEWKKEVWNFFFVGGTLVGAIIAVTIFNNPSPNLIEYYRDWRNKKICQTETSIPSFANSELEKTFWHSFSIESRKLSLWSG